MSELVSFVSFWKRMSRRVRTMDSSLIRAAEDGKLQDVRDLLLMGANINATDNELGTAFMRASAHGHLDVVVELWWM